MDIHQIFDRYTIDVNGLKKSELTASVAGYENLLPGIFGKSMDNIKLIEVIKLRLLSYILKTNWWQLSEKNIWEIFDRLNNDDFYYAILGIIYKKIPFELCLIKDNEWKIINIKYMINPEWRWYIHTKDYVELRAKWYEFEWGYEIVKAIWYEKQINRVKFLSNKSDGWNQPEYESVKEIEKSLKALKQSDEGMKSLLESVEKFTREFNNLQK